MKKFLFFIFAFSIFGFSAKAYSNNSTHPLLTREIVEHFSFFDSDKIGDQEKEWLIMGSIEEDQPIVRTFNHFFDPINKKGLNKENAEALSPLFSFLSPMIKSAVDWAQDSLVQSTFLAEFYKNAALNPYARLAKNPVEISTTYTWNKAIFNYLEGDKKSAFVSLGHVLHLLEDMAVPAHVRNDHHLSGDPYERWVSNLPNETDIALEIKSRKFPIFQSLNDYFQNLAEYSNRNFYSQDTIGIQSNYSQPEIDLLNTYIKDGFYFFNNNDEFGNFLLVRKNLSDNSFFITNKFSFIIDDPLIHRSYWSHLSKNAVLHGSGLLDLFFKEVEKRKNDQEFWENQKQTIIGRWLKNLTGFFGNLLGSNKNSDNSNSEINNDFNEDLNPSNNANQPDFKEEYFEAPSFSPSLLPRPSSVLIDSTPVISPSLIPSVFPSPEKSPDKKPNSSPTIRPTPSHSPKPSTAYGGSGSKITSANACPFEGNSLASESPIVINELAWAGTENSSSDEWIELKNISERSLNLFGWQLLDKANSIKIVFSDITLRPGEFLLLERTDDKTLPMIPADLIFSGTINDSNESLRLFTKDCALVDKAETLPDGSWPAGNKTERKTMERGEDKSWHSYSGIPESGIFGTPRRENSVFEKNSNPDPSPTPSVSPTPSPAFEKKKILISEFLFKANESDEGMEFVELYNSESEDVDLSDWNLQLSKNGAGAETLAKIGGKSEDWKIIVSHGYFLIGLNNYNQQNFSGISSDVLRSSSLSQKSDVNYEILLRDKNDNLIDSEIYKSDFCLDGESLERKARENSDADSMLNVDKEWGNGFDSDSSSDFIVRKNPEPQNHLSPIEPKIKPARPILLSGSLDDNDIPTLYFSLEKQEQDLNFQFRFKKLENGEDVSGFWENFSEIIPKQSVIKNASGNYEAKFLLDYGRYAFLISSEKSGILSEASDIYVFDIPACLPRKTNNGNNFVKNISFYSCLGRSWLDFEINWPEKPSEFKAMANVFFVNQEANSYLSANPFQDYEIFRPHSLLIKGWGGSNWPNQGNEESNMFISAEKGDASGIDWWFGSDKKFHFEVSGKTDPNGQPQLSDFSESDWISPAILYWNGNGFWQKFSGSESQEQIFFEKNPRIESPQEPVDFSGNYDQSTGKIIFNFSGKIGDDFEIKNGIQTNLNSLNWNNVKNQTLANGTISVNPQTIEVSGDFKSDLVYYFGMRFLKNNRVSSVIKTSVKIPRIVLDCSKFSDRPEWCENFENYSLGLINTYEGWENTNYNWNVVDIVSYTGKSLLNKNGGGHIEKNFSISENGGFSFKEYGNYLTSFRMKILRENNQSWLEIYNNGLMGCVDNNQRQSLCIPDVITPDKWHDWQIKWISSGQIYFRIDDGEWKNFSNISPQDATVKKIMIFLNESAIYFDDFQPLP